MFEGVSRIKSSASLAAKWPKLACQSSDAICVWSPTCGSTPSETHPLAYRPKILSDAGASFSMLTAQLQRKRKRGQLIHMKPIEFSSPKKQKKNVKRQNR